MRALLLTVILALIAQLTTAIPPGCLLHAVNTQNQPGDMSAVCGDGALTVQAHMANNCGSVEEEAQKQFIATCSAAGTVVAAYTASATSSSASATSTSTVSGTVTSGTTRSASSSSMTGTAGSTQSTAGASVRYRDGMGPMAAAAVALVGAVAAL